MEQDARDLEIEETEPYHRQYWTLQRFGWACMLLTAFAALAGVFGVGPLDGAQRSNGDIELNYSRFGRMSTSTQLTIRVGPTLTADGVVQVWVSAPYLERMSLNSIVPEPEVVSVSSGRLLYLFRAAERETVSITMELRVREGTFGLVTGQLGAVGGRDIQFTQLIWP